jgi:hypothetical protein
MHAIRCAAGFGLVATAICLFALLPAAARDMSPLAALTRGSIVTPARDVFPLAALTRGSIVTLARDVFPLAALTRGSIVTPARDDGRYANDPLHAWFDQLGSGRGLCCSFADGFSVQDVDWDTQNGRYRVKLQGEWIVVPDDAVVKEPNRFGPAVVWPYMDVNGATQIRCFMPGAGV